MLWFRLHITNLCNFDCPGCHVFKLSENKVPADNMSLATAEKSLEFFIQLIKKYLPEEKWQTFISIYGGEPLLNRQVLYAIIQKYRNFYDGVRLNWIVNTNGSLLNERDLEVFSGAGVDIHMSLDGREESHNKKRVDKMGRGTFPRVTKALDLIREKEYPYIQIDTVADPYNPQISLETIELASENKISRIHHDLFYSPNYSENFSPKEYAVNYARAYLQGKDYDIQMFASGFFQVYLNVIRRNIISSSVNRFPSLEVYADGTFIFGEFPLIRPFGHIDSLSDNQTWSRRAEILVALDREMNEKCRDCELFSHCYGEIRRIYRYHVIKTAEEDKICQVARLAVRILMQNNFIPTADVKR